MKRGVDTRKEGESCTYIAGCLKENSDLWLSNRASFRRPMREGAEVINTLTSFSSLFPIFCQGFPLTQLKKKSDSKECLCCNSCKVQVLETFLTFNVILLFLILVFCIFKRNLPGGLVYINFDNSSFTFIRREKMQGFR